MSIDPIFCLPYQGRWHCEAMTERFCPLNNNILSFPRLCYIINEEGGMFDVH